MQEGFRVAYSSLSADIPKKQKNYKNIFKKKNNNHNTIQDPITQLSILPKIFIP